MDGLLVPLVTPFDEHGAVDAAALRELAEDALDAGADGVVALATTGEPTALDDDERAVVLAVCSEVCAARGAGLVVGAGAPDTRTTLARHAALADVPAVVASLVVTPYYVRPTEAAVVAHLQHVAARSPVPLLAYNIPYRTGRGLGADALLDLAATDRVVGLKQAVGGVDADTVRLLAAAPPDFAVLAGDDPFLCALVLLGARGGITASAALATGEFATMVADARAGRAVAARERAARLLPLVEALFAEPSPAVLKAVLHAQGRIATPDLRMPLTPASPAGRDRALAELAGLGAVGTDPTRASAPTGWSAPYMGVTSQ